MEVGISLAPGLGPLGQNPTLGHVFLAGQKAYVNDRGYVPNLLCYWQNYTEDPFLLLTYNQNDISYQVERCVYFALPWST
jgi:hypothetical protein